MPGSRLFTFVVVMPSLTASMLLGADLVHSRLYAQSQIKPQSQSQTQAQAHEPLILVANKANPVSLTRAEAMKMMLGQTTILPNGKPVILVLSPAGTSERAAQLRRFCGMTESDFTRIRLHVDFRGGTSIAVHAGISVNDIKHFVKTHPGAIAFLHKTDSDTDLKLVTRVP